MIHSPWNNIGYLYVLPRLFENMNRISNHDWKTISKPILIGQFVLEEPQSTTEMF